MSEFDQILLDAGVLTYKATSGGSEVEIGFTRGGSFKDNYTLREIEVDGKRAPVVGDRVVESSAPTLEFNLLQMKSALIGDVFAGMSITDATGIKTIKRSNTIASTDYLYTVTWTGTLKNGKTAKIVLDNALGIAPVELKIADKGEIEIPATFLAHNTSVDTTTLPYSLIIDETV